MKAVLKDVPWLTVESLAVCIEGTDSDGLGLSRLQDGKVGKGDTHTVGQFGKRHLTTGHHDIEINVYHTLCNRHNQEQRGIYTELLQHQVNQCIC